MNTNLRSVFFKDYESLPFIGLVLEILYKLEVIIIITHTILLSI